MAARPGPLVWPDEAAFLPKGHTLAHTLAHAADPFPGVGGCSVTQEQPFLLPPDPGGGSQPGCAPVRLEGVSVGNQCSDPPLSYQQRSATWVSAPSLSTCTRRRWGCLVAMATQRHAPFRRLR